VAGGLGESLIRLSSRLNRHPEKRASFSHLFGSLAGWKRPVSNPTPLRAFREERVATRLEVVLCCKSKSLGYF
ncbi:hypothetical protein AAC978_02270, partial [Desulfitobacterium sp. THU1]|uniref:hypothetical protein n=1 Tax=Desulfitobacterium sp. THU1 TaxID=3138072 RepID=UPI00311FC64C